MRETFQRRLRHADAFADARPPMRFGGFRRFRGVKGVYDLRDETQPLVMGSQHEFAVGQPSQVWDGTTVGGAHRGESVNGAMTTFASNFHCHPLPHVEVAVAVHIGIGVAIGANHPALKVNVSFAVFADKVLLNAHSLGVAVAALAHLGQAELLSVVRARQKGVDEGMGVAPTSLCSRQRLPMRRFAFAVVGVGHVASGTATGTKRSLLRLRRIGLDVALDAIAQEGAGKGRRLQRPKMAQLVDRSRRRCWLPCRDPVDAESINAFSRLRYQQAIACQSGMERPFHPSHDIAPQNAMTFCLPTSSLGDAQIGRVDKADEVRRQSVKGGNDAHLLLGHTFGHGDMGAAHHRQPRFRVIGFRFGHIGIAAVTIHAPKHVCLMRVIHACMASGADTSAIAGLQRRWQPFGRFPSVRPKDKKQRRQQER